MTISLIPSNAPIVPSASTGGRLSSALGNVRNSPAQLDHADTGVHARGLRENDRADLSPEAQEAAGSAGSTGSSRADLIRRIRGEIAAGSYDTPEKYLTALSRAVQDAEGQE